MLDWGAAARQARTLDRLEHRPWPPPERPWTIGQTWEELLFAHWRVPLEELRPHVPDELEVESFDGSAWLGIVPFRINATRLRGTLPPPLLSSFLELNVRTVVRAGDGPPGIWFLSLDTSSRLAVEVGRRGYRLPYFHARMSAAVQGGWIEYECARMGEPGRVFCGRYRPVGAAASPEPGSLEWFLAERHCLYAEGRRGRLERAEIHHAPWSLQPAEAEIELTSIAPFALDGEPLCHFARRQDALIWSLSPVG